MNKVGITTWRGLKIELRPSMATAATVWDSVRKVLRKQGSGVPLTLWGTVILGITQISPDTSLRAQKNRDTNPRS